jgi:predicted metal-dependent HD superfamily phosphohydrolase
MPRNNIVVQSARFVASLLNTRSFQWSYYHNSRHTASTVAACRKIGRVEGLDSDELEVVTVAGWFHDTGYTVSANRHEEASAAIAMEFLTKEGYPARKIRKVLGCIMATKVPQRPRMLRDRVICDADMVSLGRRNFFTLNELLRQETSERENRTIGMVEWLRRTEVFLTAHRFHTAYGRTALERGRQRSLATVQRLLRSRRSKNAIKTSGKKNRMGKELGRKS